MNEEAEPKTRTAPNNRVCVREGFSHAWNENRVLRGNRPTSREYELLKSPAERVCLLYARGDTGEITPAPRVYIAAGFPHSRLTRSLDSAESSVVIGHVCTCDQLQ